MEENAQGSIRAIAIMAVAIVVAGTSGWWLRQATFNLDRASPTSDASEVEQARQAYQQQREKSEQLERQLTGALRHVATLAAEVGNNVAQKEEVVDLRRALEEERSKAAVASRDGAASHQAQMERERSEGLARNLAAEQRENEMLKKAGDKAAVQIVEVQNRAEVLARDLATARGDSEASRIAGRNHISELEGQIDGLRAEIVGVQRENTALREAGDRSADQKKIAALEAKVEGLTRDLEAAAEAAQKAAEVPQIAELPPGVPGPREQPTAPPTPEPPQRVAASGTTSPIAPARPLDPGLRRLMARAKQMLEQRNISAARSILERASDSGNPQVLFALAETYDPNKLAEWGTVGLKGDAVLASTLYDKAWAGGVQEAAGRLKALHP